MRLDAFRGGLAAALSGAIISTSPALPAAAFGLPFALPSIDVSQQQQALPQSVMSAQDAAPDLLQDAAEDLADAAADKAAEIKSSVIDPSLDEANARIAKNTAELETKIAKAKDEALANAPDPNAALTKAQVQKVRAGVDAALADVWRAGVQI